MIKFNKLFTTTALLILLFESLSFVGYLSPSVNIVMFFILVLLTLVISLYKLEYGVLIVLAELFIGSKGYLYNFIFNGSNISIRIALWSVVLVCWFILLLKNLYQTKRLIAAPKENFKKLFSGVNKYYVFFFIAVLWGAINGFINNDAHYVFLDFKRWIYFLLFLPLFSVIKTRENVEKLLTVFFASITMLSIKSFLLLFIFSHEMLGAVYELYRWVRVTGVGEITQIQGGFYRIFFQSHIFVLLGLIITLVYLAKQIIDNQIKIVIKQKVFLQSLILTIIFMSVTLLSFSRSFWVGLIGGFFFIYLYMMIEIYNSKNQERKLFIKKIFENSTLFLSITFLSLLLIVALVKFPYPKPLGGFDPTDVFSERATETDEAAIGSRWALLPKLWLEIKEAPVFGKGFGATVTYQTLDPRVLELNPSGEYTTYAFEWGWLDIWLKLGLVGTLVYLALLFQPMYLFFKEKKQSILEASLIIGLFVLMIINFFTPYLNHPLGIGFLGLIIVIIYRNNAVLQKS